MRFLSCFLFLALFIGCGSRNNSTQGNAVTAFPVEKGKVIPSVTCIKFANTSYALYLPQNYSPARKFPVIIAFDPSGNGSIPVVKYRELADRFGYILMGSNDSKNGQDLNTSSYIIDALFSETTGRYAIDTSRIYVMGFSGGARIASLIGFFQGGVAGVIGCGAGLPATRQQIRFKPDYIGLAGNADFNMTELIQLDKQLDQVKFPHALILFNGRHAWPPADIMENAFFWIEFCAMRNNFIPKNDSLIREYTSMLDLVLKEDHKTGDAIAEYNHLLNLIRFTDGLAPTGILRQRLGDLQKSEVYLKSLKKQQKVMEKEMEEQKLLNDNFFSKDLDWWSRKIGTYNSRIYFGKDSSDVRMCSRLKSYLSLLCYMSYSRMISANDTSAANHAMKIYEAVDPENATRTKSGK
jgi:predicted esterase